MTQARSRGIDLDSSPEAFGWLRETDTKTSDAALRMQVERDGYLYLPGFFDRDDVVTVRHEILSMLKRKGHLEPGSEPSDALPHRARTQGISSQMGSSSMDDIGRDCQAMQTLLYGDHTKRFFSRFLGATVRHFDLTWFRAIAPGLGTVPHCDVVYMGRGTKHLYTIWVPYSDIALQMGGLMILENSGSPRVQNKLSRYLRRDVDEYCSNEPLPAHMDLTSVTDNKVWNGWLTDNPVSLRKNLGGRWLTAEYRMGDAVVFPIHVVHGSLDNQSDKIRLSSDARYQREDDPIDDRFVGAAPFGHIGSAKRGRIC